MAKAHLLASWTIGLAAVLLAAPCQGQGNIDRGKTPAQAFADTCAGCHRSPRSLKRTSAVFLRMHYTPSWTEASAMAAYLAGFPSEPAQQAKRPAADAAATRAEAAKQQAKQQPKQQQPIARTADQGKAAPLQPGNERLANLADAPAIADPSPAPAVAPKPVLEPFEE
jgi:hypothetical protein